MASQQFCLRWNNYQSNLMQVFDQLLQTESFVDVTLSCEGNSVKAHRMVLSACSPYFQCLLSDAPCSHPVIILQGVKWPELKAVVEFMYKGEINICQEQLGSLLRVAESLKIRGLAEVDGDGAEPAVLTSPSVSPIARAHTNFLDDNSPSSVLAAVARKRRRLSGDDLSRPCTPMTPTSGTEMMEATLDLTGPLIRGGLNTSLPGSPLTSLAARLPGAMPPPAPMAPHLTHLPPLSPLLNMHSLPRPHAPDDFEIRPGIAEMIREEERVINSMRFSPGHEAVFNRRRDAPDMAKLLESSHHWMGTSMADGGGPVFPTMFADPPGGVVAASTAASANKLTSPQKPGTAALAPPPPVSVSKDLVHTSKWNAAEHSVFASKSSVHASSDVPPITTVINHTSVSAAPITTTTGDGGKGSISVFSTVDPEELSISSALTGGVKPTSRCVSPSAGVVCCGTKSSAGGASNTTVEDAWDTLRGAISAPKSGASRWTQSDLMAALALVKTGTPIKPAAERCNIPVMTLWRRTRALGIVSSKVQCGFRYPAARRRPKSDQHNHIRMKHEPELQFPVKTESETLRQSKSDVEDYLRCCGGLEKDLRVSRAGPLKEMSAVHASCRVASRESSPRPSGRENSPLFPSRASSPKSKEISAGHLDKETPVALGKDNNYFPKSADSPLIGVTESSSRPQRRENAHKDTEQPFSKDFLQTTMKTSQSSTENDSSPALAGALPPQGRADRFRAWVDIVLDRADGPQQHQQQDSPQDLTTRHQRLPTSHHPPSPTTTTTTATTTTIPPQPSTSLVHH